MAGTVGTMVEAGTEEGGWEVAVRMAAAAAAALVASTPEPLPRTHSLECVVTPPRVN